MQLSSSFCQEDPSWHFCFGSIGGIGNPPPRVAPLRAYVQIPAVGHGDQIRMSAPTDGVEDRHPRACGSQRPSNLLDQHAQARENNHCELNRKLVIAITSVRTGLDGARPTPPSVLCKAGATKK